MALYRKIDPGQQHRGRRALRRSTQLTHTHYTCACAISEHRCVASHSRHRRKQQVSFFLPLSHLLSFVVVFNICHSNHRESVCPVCLPTYLTNLLSERAHTHTRLARFLLFELIEFAFVQFFNGPLFVCVCVPLLLLLGFYTHCFVYTSPLARPIILYRRPYRHCIPCGTITNIHQLQLCFSTLFIFLFFLLSISSFILLLFTVFALVLMFVEFVVDEMQSVESTWSVPLGCRIAERIRLSILFIYIIRFIHKYSLYILHMYAASIYYECEFQKDKKKTNETRETKMEREESKSQ